LGLCQGGGGGGVAYSLRNVRVPPYITAAPTGRTLVKLDTIGRFA